MTGRFINMFIMCILYASVLHPAPDLQYFHFPFLTSLMSYKSLINSVFLYTIELTKTRNFEVETQTAC